MSVNADDILSAIAEISNGETSSQEDWMKTYRAVYPATKPEPRYYVKEESFKTYYGAENAAKNVARATSNNSRVCPIWFNSVVVAIATDDANGLSVHKLDPAKCQ